MNRRGLLALVHCARKDLALTEDTYRAILERVGGASSAAELSDGALGRVVDHLRGLGWKPKSGSGVSSDPAVRKIWAIWGDLARMGALRTDNRAAARSYFERLTKVADPEWMTPAQKATVIESLKQWKARTERERRDAEQS